MQQQSFDRWLDGLKGLGEYFHVKPTLFDGDQNRDVWKSWYDSGNSELGALLNVNLREPIIGSLDRVTRTAS